MADRRTFSWWVARLGEVLELKVSKRFISNAAPFQTTTRCGGASIVACCVRNNTIVLKERVLAQAMLQGYRIIVKQTEQQLLLSRKASSFVHL